MSVEANFHLTGYVNKDCRYWAESNPKEVHERPLHSSKVTVWCAVSSYGVIRPYFFENEERIMSLRIGMLRRCNLLHL